MNLRFRWIVAVAFLLNVAPLRMHSAIAQDHKHGLSTPSIITEAEERAELRREIERFIQEEYCKDMRNISKLESMQTLRRQRLPFW